MASMDIGYINPLAIAGLGKTLTETDMVVSRSTYNGLTYIGDQDRPAENYSKHLRATIALIFRHGMGKYFRPHVAHRHDFLPSNKVRLETPLEGTLYKLTKATDISKLDFDDMHPTCFKVIGNDFVSTEHARGPAPLAASKIPDAFLQDWADYLNKYGLTNLLTLDFGYFEEGVEATTEIEVQIGDTAATLVVPLSAVTSDGVSHVPTSWVVCAPRPRSLGEPDPSPEKPSPGTYWLERVAPQTHKVMVDSEAGTDEQLVDALIKAGVLKAT